MPRLTPKQARQYVRLQQIKIAERRLEAIETFETTGGELPKIDLSIIEAKAIEVEAVKVTAETEKAKLESDAAKIDEQTKPTEKDAALKEIAAKEQYLASLESHKLELAFQERLTKGELLKEDEAEVIRRKEALARDIEEKRQALKANGLIDDPKAEERLRNRARVKAALERQANG